MGSCPLVTMGFGRILPTFFVCLIHCTLFATFNAEEIKQVFIKKYIYGGENSFFVNSSVEYIFEFDIKKSNSAHWDRPARVSVSSIFANKSHPVFITARQQKGVLSWQLPVILDNNALHSLSRTLCPNNNYYLDNDLQDDNNTQNHPIIHIYTSSYTNIHISLIVDLVKDFYLKPNVKRKMNISPSMPSIFFYSFDYDKTEENNRNQDVRVGRYSERPGHYTAKENMKTVIVRIDSAESTCMLISIQNASCPVYDTENNIMYEGFYETVSKRGGITITEQKFPFGFYVVLLVKTSDEDCQGYASNTSISHFTNFFDFESQPFDFVFDPTSNLHNRDVNDRLKDVVLQITPTITKKEYWLATMIAFIIILLIYIIFLIGLFCYKHKPKSLTEIDNVDYLWLRTRITENVSCRSVTTISTVCDSIAFLQANFRDAMSPTSADGSANGISPDITDDTSAGCSHHRRKDSEWSLKLSGNDGHIYLNQLCTKETHVLIKQSDLYLWHLLTIAVFYALPVIQLVVTYQRVLNQSGNQDLCYYNFLCAHPLGYLSDFNHVYSNLGYVLLGGLFVFIVWKRHKHHMDPKFDKYFGIPQHHGLYYAMGVALIMEGVLSASYHVCPNHSNFQFDTSFMYIMAVLSMVKIYQTRHPDINAKAHSTYGILAAAILICLIGVLHPNFYFWVFFTIVHIMTCLFLTFKIYYLGRWKFSFEFFICCRPGKCHPAYGSRLVLVLLANLCNWALAGYGLYIHSKDFATHLLYVFLMNLALHLIFYISMKVTKGERPTKYTWVLLLTAMITWGGALYFFFTPNTSWALTPAQSRIYNEACSMLNFYDNHDIWHMLSAMAMFFSFMLLLTLDDDITHKLREQILVF